MSARSIEKRRAKFLKACEIFTPHFRDGFEAMLNQQSAQGLLQSVHELVEALDKIMDED